ncbi:necrosis inducing protein-domain-containing protein [Podospora aff. communis PSN243]|uniref:Necrosis inducing protein-domain-containing protein n=1 Tax=Podospora aff. communis PSN243 TaxID=3040156 RepID=A0AAV9G4K0_9PEZI|nr:necrosis inducing protein-domain-containing protein [Podospora aff. communis PSN243]
MLGSIASLGFSIRTKSPDNRIRAVNSSRPFLTRTAFWFKPDIEVPSTTIKRGPCPSLISIKHHQQSHLFGGLKMSHPNLIVALLAGLVGSSAAAAVSLTPELNLFRRDPVPTHLPGCSNPDDSKFQPVLDFDRDGCYNVPAIGADGFLNPGAGCRAGSSPEGGCRDEWDLLNDQVYARTRCNNGWCAHMYGYYFEKDWRDGLCAIGHVHDWEHVVVWTRVENGQRVAKYVAASAHGKYNIKSRTDSSLRWHGGTHPKIVYHRDDAGGGTHAFRFARADDDNLENHFGTWIQGVLISYRGYPSEWLRNRMLSHNWGAATIDFKDAVFQAALNKARPAEASAFNSGTDEQSPGKPNGCGF